MSRLFNSITLLYAIMLIPAVPITWGIFDPAGYYSQLMFQSGIWSIYFLIITIAVSPVRLILNRLGIWSQLGRWLLVRRRHTGIVTAVYAGLHLLLYFTDIGSMLNLALEALEFKIAVGWLAMIIMVLLAVTSNTAAIRKLGRKWKTLHNWIYPAAALTFVHWYMFDWLTSRVMFWVGLFCAIKLGHGLIKMIPRRGRPATQTPAS